MDQIFVNGKHFILEIAGKVLPDPIIILMSMLISIAAIASFGPFVMMYLTWLERKVVARIQNRIGPNRVGIFGLLQPVADGIKMLTKEDIIPENADKFAHLFSPILVVVPVLLTFAVLPFGRNMIAVDLNIGLLFFLGVSSIGIIAIFMGCWGSRNKYSLLGGMRAAAQMISYEIPMALAALPVVIVTSSLSTSTIVEAQLGGHWHVFTPWGILGAIVFFLCGVAEVNRTPFDLAEAESEIIAGFHTEYSGMKFALFYMGEFMAAFAVSGLTVTLFLGGWDGPFLPSWAWFLIKTYLLVIVMIWFRGTFPRFRVDQLMGFAWKVLLPFTILNILVTALWTKIAAPINWIVAIVLLIGGISFLNFINKKDIPQKREFILAD